MHVYFSVLFHTLLLFFPNAGWSEINRLSHSEARTVFQNKVPALFDQTYFIPPFFSYFFSMAFSQVTGDESPFFAQKTPQWILLNEVF